jgi:DEAD/DEAH box helicase domain-containing protein
MEEDYFGSLLPALASRASLGTVGWLGFANAPLRRHLMQVFARPFGDTGSFLADPTFEAVFGWAPSSRLMRDLAGNLLTPSVVNAMDSPPTELADEYRFAKERAPYAHQLQAWEILAQQPAKSLIVTSGTGSGKTECFMVPILDRLAREQLELGSQLVGVRALFLYPLNALINSQRDRLQCLDAWVRQQDPVLPLQRADAGNRACTCPRTGRQRGEGPSDFACSTAADSGHQRNNARIHAGQGSGRQHPGKVQREA